MLRNLRKVISGLLAWCHKRFLGMKNSTVRSETGASPWAKSFFA
jgi:hypothetical protein